MPMISKISNVRIVAEGCHGGNKALRHFKNGQRLGQGQRHGNDRDDHAIDLRGTRQHFGEIGQFERALPKADQD